MKISIVDPKEYQLKSDEYRNEPFVDELLDINTFIPLSRAPNLYSQKSSSTFLNENGFTIKGPQSSMDYIFSHALNLARRHDAKLIDFDCDFINDALIWYIENKYSDKFSYFQRVLLRFDDVYLYLAELFQYLLNDPNQKFIVLIRNFDIIRLGTTIGLGWRNQQLKSPSAFILTVLEDPETNKKEMQFNEVNPKVMFNMVTDESMKNITKRFYNEIPVVFGLETIDLTETYLSHTDHKLWKKYIEQLTKDMNVYQNTKIFRTIAEMFNVKVVDSDGDDVTASLGSNYEPLKKYFEERVYDKNEISLVIKNGLKTREIINILDKAKKNIIKEDDSEGYKELSKYLNERMSNVPKTNTLSDKTELNILIIEESFDLLIQEPSEEKRKSDIINMLTPSEKKVYDNYVDPDRIDTTFDDIGSLENAKEELLSLLVPLRLKSFQKNKLIKLPTGILLYGPPGTGKTMLARALAKTANVSFIHISASSILSSWVGESEENTASIFTMARKLSPCIIFVDEVDGLLHSRSSGEHDSGRRIKNEFFSGWDGLFSSTSDADQVTVICATNRPFDLDTAALRRLPHRVLVPLPDKAARKEIFEKNLRHVKFTFEWNGEDKEISNEERERFIESLAERTENYSGSDIKSLCVRAALQLVRDFMSDSEYQKLVENNKENQQKLESLAEKYALRPITMKEFEIAFKEIQPSTNPKSKTQLELTKWHNTFGTKDGKKPSPKLGF